MVIVRSRMLPCEARRDCSGHMNGIADMERINDSSTFTVQLRVIFVVNPAATILLDVDGGRYYTLNETGAEIWDQLCAQAPMATIAAHLRRCFAISSETDVNADLRSFISALLEAGLVWLA
jgi:hypothetical protein